MGRFILLLSVFYLVCGNYFGCLCGRNIGQLALGEEEKKRLEEEERKRKEEEERRKNITFNVRIANRLVETKLISDFFVSWEVKKCYINGAEAEKEDLLHYKWGSARWRTGKCEDKESVTIVLEDPIMSMKCMFSGCSNLSEIDGLGEYTRYVADMSCMFDGCSSLKTLSDISKWDTSNVTNMDCMFRGCSSLKTLPDISKWNTEKVACKHSITFGFEGVCS